MEMDHVRVKKFLTFALLLCLLLILIIFCSVYIWNTIKDSVKETPGHLKIQNEVQTFTTTDHHADHTANTDHSHEHEDTESKGKGYRVKLSGKEQATSGKVLIEYDGATGFVCSDDFDDADALVVCRELGFKKGRAYDLMSSFPYSRYTDLKPFLTELDCTGKEAKLEDCKGFQLQNISVCTWFAAAFCFDDKPYEMRLTNGIMPDSGLVEMKVGGEWGVVCAIRNFDDEVADILCRSMNFTGGFALQRGVMGSSKMSKVWVPYVSCLEGPDIKRSILDCSLILNTENIIMDRVDHRNNRYANEYMACLDKTNAYSAAVQCLL